MEFTLQEATMAGKRWASRTYGQGGRGYSKYRSTGARRAPARRVVPGRYRKIGYWGRYAGAGGRAGGTQELKFHDIDWTEAAADMTAGLISNTSSLVLIGQGITESTRIGRKCVIKSIGWRARLQFIAVSGAGTQAPQTTRFMLVHDTQCNGTAPLVGTAAGVLETADFQSFNNLANKGRFKTLLDRTYTSNSVAGAGNGTANDFPAVNRDFSFFKKCNIPIEYSGVANPSVITEVRTNNIFGIMITSDSAASVVLASKFRFRFSDG